MSSLGVVELRESRLTDTENEKEETGVKKLQEKGSYTQGVNLRIVKGK